MSFFSDIEKYRIKSASKYDVVVTVVNSPLGKGSGYANNEHAVVVTLNGEHGKAALESTLLHEIGHILGNGDEYFGGSFQINVNGAPYGVEEKRLKRLKDIRGEICFIIFILLLYNIILPLRAAGTDNETGGEITLTVNGEEKEIRPKILNKDGAIYIPVVGVTKFLYASFADYSSSANTIITVNRYATIFTNKINTDMLSVRGGKIKISGSSFYKSGDYYVTEEFLETVFGINCKYNENTNSVIIWQTDETDIKKLPQEIQGLDEAMRLRHYQPQYLERYVTYKKARKELGYYDVVTYVNIGLDLPYYSNVKEIKNPKSVLVLCNKYNYLPEDFVPEGYKQSDGRVLKLWKDAQEQFDIMRADAAKSGVYIYIVSGYRSYTVQNQIYNNYKRNDPNGADTYSARAGYSEHQTGLAADLNSASVSSHFENTKEYAWLIENAHKYGFILRYPKDKEWITGYIFEPWHWRYVGVKRAGKIKELGITFDEYYAIYLVPQNY